MKSFNGSLFKDGSVVLPLTPEEFWNSVFGEEESIQWYDFFTRTSIARFEEDKELNPKNNKNDHFKPSKSSPTYGIDKFMKLISDLRCTSFDLNEGVETKVFAVSKRKFIDLLSSINMLHLFHPQWKQDQVRSYYLRTSSDRHILSASTVGNIAKAVSSNFFHPTIGFDASDDQNRPHTYRVRLANPSKREPGQLTLEMTTERDGTISKTEPIFIHRVSSDRPLTPVFKCQGFTGSTITELIKVLFKQRVITPYNLPPCLYTINDNAFEIEATGTNYPNADYDKRVRVVSIPASMGDPPVKSTSDTEGENDDVPFSAAYSWSSKVTPSTSRIPRGLGKKEDMIRKKRYQNRNSSRFQQQQWNNSIRNPEPRRGVPSTRNSKKPHIYTPRQSDDTYNREEEKALLEEKRHMLFADHMRRSDSPGSNAPPTSPIQPPKMRMKRSYAKLERSDDEHRNSYNDRGRKTIRTNQCKDVVSHRPSFDEDKTTSRYHRDQQTPFVRKQRNRSTIYLSRPIENQEDIVNAIRSSDISNKHKLLALQRAVITEDDKIDNDTIIVEPQKDFVEEGEIFDDQQNAATAPSSLMEEESYVLVE